jgi:6-phosphogluconolactonase
MSREMEVVADPAAVAAERIATVVRGGGHVALAGGSTPRRAYELLAAMDDLDWSGADLWLGDDRCVPPDDERSNARMVREELVERIPEGRRPRAWHSTHAELGPEHGGEAFDDELRTTFGTDGEPPVFDLVLLGIGPDGHTASLFPGKPAVDERARWAVGVPEAGLEPFVPRVTLTLPTLRAAREVMFLISGESKAEAVARAFGGPPRHDTPSSLVRPDPGRLTVLLDAPAARLLGPGA